MQHTQEHDSHQSPQSVRLRRALPWVAGIVLGIVVAGVGMRMRVPADSQATIRLTAVHPGGEVVGSPIDADVVLSSNGTHLVYVAGSGGATVGRLYARALDELEPTLLAESARSPFLSPDDQWVGFMSGDEGTWMKVPIAGGQAVRIGGPGGGTRGATWGPDDTIIFSAIEVSTGLLRISAAGGGEAEVLTTPDEENGELTHVFPEFLPGGDAILFTITNNEGSAASQIALLDLNTGEYHTLVPGAGQARYASSGHIVYGVSGALRAVAFDLDALEVRGAPAPVMDGVRTKPSGAASFSVSSTGALAYLTGGASTTPIRQMVWVGRDGTEEVLAIEPQGYEYVRVSHDGRRMAVDEANLGGDIWVWDFESETSVRLVEEEGSEQYAVWTLDDARIASSKSGSNIVSWKASDNSGVAEAITPPMGKGTQSVSAYFFAEADRTLVFREQAHPETGDNIGMISLDPGSEPVWLLAGEFNERNAELSPDGKWMAYQSDESGAFEIYVRPFPNVHDDQWKISAAGGLKPLWARNGRELFYLEPGTPARMMAVPVETAAAFEYQAPQVLLEWPYFGGTEGRAYDASLDGQRFLTVVPVETEDAPPPQINIVLNWFEELTQQVAGP
jgi:Tol biopolymer transport system component